MSETCDQCCTHLCTLRGVWPTWESDWLPDSDLRQCLRLSCPQDVQGPVWPLMVWPGPPGLGLAALLPADLASIETFWADYSIILLPAWLWCPGLSLCPGSCLRSRSAACACVVSSPCSCPDTRSLTRMRWSRAPSSLLPLSQSQFLLKSNICRRGFHHSPASTAFLEIDEKNYVKFKFYIESK